MSIPISIFEGKLFPDPRLVQINSVFCFELKQ